MSAADPGPTIAFVPSLDADPGERPPPTEEDGGGMETENELAEEMARSREDRLAAGDARAGLTASGPGEEEGGGGGGMETEQETRSPGRRGEPALG